MTVLSDIVARLRNQAPIFRGQVSKARNLASPEITALPQCWVGLWNTSYDVEHGANINRIRAFRQIIVQFVVSPEYTDSAVDQHDDVKIEVINALSDLAVGPNGVKLYPLDETLVSLAEGHALWRMIFEYWQYDT